MHGHDRLLGMTENDVSVRVRTCSCYNLSAGGAAEGAVRAAAAQTRARM